MVGVTGGLGGSSSMAGGSSPLGGTGGFTTAGGTTASGGSPVGGSPGVGGTGMGGTAMGGTAMGGMAAGGMATGGMATGGMPSGGAVSTGGTPAMGGTPAGGAGSPSGGTPGTAGTPTSGGMPGAGSAGAPPSGGAAGSAGAQATAGAAGSPSGGASEPGTCPQGAPVPASDLLSKCTMQSGNTECVLGGDPGYYQVSVLLGGPDAGIRVQAESRRFIVGEATVGADATRCVTTTVQVRQPEGQPKQDVDAGTPGLNLFIEGSETALQGLAVASAEPIVIYIAGDSTVCDQSPQRYAAPGSRYSGWGQMLPQFLDERVAVANYSDSGEGTSSYRVDGGSLWRPIGDNLKEGDFVLIQLGHNDKNTNAATYRSRITGMVQATKQAGATPVLISPMIRNTGDPLSSQHIYGDLNVRNELAGISQAESVPYIDLMEITANWAAELGRSAAQEFYTDDDKTHSNEVGAQLFAEFLVDAMVEQSLPITEYLR